MTTDDSPSGGPALASRKGQIAWGRHDRRRCHRLGASTRCGPPRPARTRPPLRLEAGATRRDERRRQGTCRTRRLQPRPAEPGLAGGARRTRSNLQAARRRTNAYPGRRATPRGGRDSGRVRRHDPQSGPNRRVGIRPSAGGTSENSWDIPPRNSSPRSGCCRPGLWPARTSLAPGHRRDGCARKQGRGPVPRSEPPS
jgi:hypothetical protein